MKYLLVRAHHKRGCFFGMKRTRRFPIVCACTSQTWHVFTYHFHDIQPLFYVVYFRHNIGIIMFFHLTAFCLLRQVTTEQDLILRSFQIKNPPPESIGNGVHARAQGEVKAPLNRCQKVGSPVARDCSQSRFSNRILNWVSRSGKSPRVVTEHSCVVSVSPVAFSTAVSV